MSDELSSMTLHQLISLEHDVRAWKDKRMAEYQPPPAGQCNNCGEVWYYHGSWKQHRFEQQAEAFRAKHANCLPIADGGCI